MRNVLFLRSCLPVLEPNWFISCFISDHLWAVLESLWQSHLGASPVLFSLCSGLGPLARFKPLGPQLGPQAINILASVMLGFGDSRSHWRDVWTLGTSRGSREPVGAPSGSWGLPGAPRGPRNLEGRSTLGFLVAHTNSKKPSGA